MLNLITCPECTRKIHQPGINFCPHCGASLSSVDWVGSSGSEEPLPTAPVTIDEEEESLSNPASGNPTKKPRWRILIWVLLALLIICGLALFAYFYYSKNTLKADEKVGESLDLAVHERKEPPQFTVSDADRLYPGWTLLRAESLMVGSSDYAVVILGKASNDQYNLDTMIAVCQEKEKAWDITWEIPETIGMCSVGRYDIEHPDEFSDRISDILYVVDSNKAIVVFDIVTDGGSYGSVGYAIVLMLSEDDAIMKFMENEFNIQTEKQEDRIILTADYSFGKKIFCLKKGQFHQTNIPLSECFPSDSVQIPFIIGNDNRVYPAKDKCVSVNVGQTITFVPANEKAKIQMDNGGITIYIDSGVPVSCCNASRLRGITCENDWPGLFYVQVENIDENNPDYHSEYQEPTFVVEVTP